MSQPPQRLERLGAEIQIFKDPVDACDAAADRICSAILLGQKTRGRAVIGLATGATPEPVYTRLVEKYLAGDLSFRDVSTYNLDEYYPISPLDPQSYRSYMHRHLFSKVDIASHRAHVLDGTVPAAFVAEHAAHFDRWLESEDGLDFQLLGIGRNGHIGFNEPSTLEVERALALPTRLVDLHSTTIADAVRDFGEESRVPRQALTMGIASILAARSIVVLAFGEHKADAVVRSLTGPVTAAVPGSLLQTIPGKVTWMIDRAAGSKLV